MSVLSLTVVYVGLCFIMAQLWLICFPFLIFLPHYLQSNLSKAQVWPWHCLIRKPSVVPHCCRTSAEGSRLLLQPALSSRSPLLFALLSRRAFSPGVPACLCCCSLLRLCAHRLCSCSASYLGDQLLVILGSSAQIVPFLRKVLWPPPPLES